MNEFLAQHGDLIGQILLAILGIVATILAKRWKDHQQLIEALHQDVQSVVTEVYHEYVKDLKKAREDGKLKDKEAKEARQMALSRIRTLGAQKGKDWVKEYGVPFIISLIEKYVSANK